MGRRRIPFNRSGFFVTKTDWQDVVARHYGRRVPLAFQEKARLAVCIFSVFDHVVFDVNVLLGLIYWRHYYLRAELGAGAGYYLRIFVWIERIKH